jgi:hypothetical protein
VKEVQYAKDESVVLKKHFDGWKSRKKQKTDKKAAPQAAAAVSAPEAIRPATRAQVRLPTYFFLHLQSIVFMGRQSIVSVLSQTTVREAEGRGGRQLSKAAAAVSAPEVNRLAA